ncbi:MAG: DUF4352 domain-containing protein [Actinomycetia bacterium]|nr:DUF4352 domain-containing protein [Actinomycetes bacterium]
MRLRMRATFFTLLLSGVLLVGAAGCGEAPESPGEVGPDSSTGTSTTGDVKIGALGERRNPIPLGQEAEVGDWKVKVVGAILDATRLVLETNMFNDPPEAGRRYVLVSLEATYVGKESSTFWLDMSYRFIGGKGDSFDTAAAVAPDSIMDEGEVSPGACITGNLVFEVASDQLSGGTLLLEEAFSFEQTRVFFALQ